MICPCGCVLIQVLDPDDAGGCCDRGLKAICPRCRSHKLGSGDEIDRPPDLTPILSRDC